MRQGLKNSGKECVEKLEFVKLKMFDPVDEFDEHHRAKQYGENNTKKRPEKMRIVIYMVCFSFTGIV